MTKTFPNDPAATGNKQDRNSGLQRQRGVDTSERDQETGFGRTNVRAVIANLGNREHANELHTLEFNLAKRFGGYTRTHGRGGWVKGSTVLDEPTLIFDISFLSDLSTFDRVNSLRALFADVGQRIGEDWVHIEVSSFEAYHTKCSARESFPRKGGGTYRAIDPAVHTREALARNRIK